MCQIILSFLKKVELLIFLRMRETNVLMSKKIEALFLELRIFGQNQPFRGVLGERHAENMQQIFKGTAVPKCDWFNNTTSLKSYFSMGVVL